MFGSHNNEGCKYIWFYRVKRCEIFLRVIFKVHLDPHPYKNTQTDNRASTPFNRDGKEF